MFICFFVCRTKQTIGMCFLCLYAELQLSCIPCLSGICRERVWPHRGYGPCRRRVSVNSCPDSGCVSICVFTFNLYIVTSMLLWSDTGKMSSLLHRLIHVKYTWFSFDNFCTISDICSATAWSSPCKFNFELICARILDPCLLIVTWLPLSWH